MKFKIKQFNSILRRRLSESRFLIKKRLSKWRDAFLEKGHEKMTVMFIPHNEKKIFNFHISKFTISFFVILFFIIIITSFYTLKINANTKAEKQRLLSNYKDARSHLIQFEMLTTETADLVDEIKPYVEDLYELSKGNINVKEIWDSVNGDECSSDELKTMKNILPDEIFILRDMQEELACTTKTIKTIKNFIDVRSKVIYEIPSMIPNVGHISSLYGWRRSPFGFGRHFHQGIDIAAASGTPIKATARGTVVTAGWGQGYGFLVRIRHKYGFQTLYGHCKKLACKEGDVVERGETVAYVGQTGSATGNHCHYEIRIGNNDVNPYPYMSKLW